MDRLWNELAGVALDRSCEPPPAQWPVRSLRKRPKRDRESSGLESAGREQRPAGFVEFVQLRSPNGPVPTRVHHRRCSIHVH